MNELDNRYPGYGFKKNKGYPTKEHIGAIKELGPTPFHRLSFKPELYE
jgi:ribonuclease HII